MDLFEHTCGMDKVDLDDLSIYPDEWLLMTPYDLWRKCWLRAGESIFYMQFIHPEEGTQPQAYRVYRMCAELADELWPIALDEHNPDSHLKIMKWLYRFEDEVENQC